MFLETVCTSLARRVSCAASCFTLICCLSSSFSFFFLSFASFLILLNLAHMVDSFFGSLHFFFLCFGLSQFSFFTLSWSL